MKKDIIIDFDGVLFDTGEATLSWLEEHYSITIPRGNYNCGSSLHHLVSKYLPQGSPVVDEFELYELIGKGFLASMEHHQDIPPMEGSVEALKVLAERYTLHVATARLTLGKDVVKAMLDTHFPGCISSIHHVWHINEPGDFSSTPKKSFIETLQYPVLFIDDSPREIVDVITTVDTALFDPENLHPTETNMTHRVQSWNAVSDILQTT